MSFRFHRSIPNLSIFHYAKSPHSTHILQRLRAALSNPYIPQRIAAARAQAESSGTMTDPKVPQRPLEFNLDVSTVPPTTDQYQTMLDYLRSQPSSPALSMLGPPSLSRFLVKHSQNVSSTDELADLAGKNPEAVRWPVVVHWDDGLVAIEREEEVDHILDVIYEQTNTKAQQTQDWLS